MKLPKSIKVGGFVFTIVEKPELDGSWGECNFEKMEISIATKQEETGLRNSLFHEIIHAIIFERFHGSKLITDKNEEQIVEGITNGLLSLFANNPQILTLFRRKRNGKSSV